MDKDTALKIASGLGAGFRSGEICGAASGAVLVVGLKYGQRVAEDTGAKVNCNAKTVELLNAFRAKNKSCVCRELLGYDIGAPDGYARAQNAGLFKTKCVDLVKSAVETLEELGY